MDNLSTQPLISCLMATRDRLPLVRQAVRCFVDQTYPHKELLLVTEADEAYRAGLAEIAQEYPGAAIRVVGLPAGDWNLGKVRNAAIDAAAGPLLCQWDDDDLSHPDRLAAQASRLLADGSDACFLTEQLQHFEGDAHVHYLDWANHEKDPIAHMIPGTLLVRADPRWRYLEGGELAVRGEDSELLDRLWREGTVCALRGMGHLFLYRFHGANTWEREHHHQLARYRSQRRRFVRRKRRAILAALRYFGFEPPVRVLGRGQRVACTYRKRHARGRRGGPS